MNLGSATLIDMLRHGEPDGGQKFRGAIDDPLSALGWVQMRAAAGDYRDWEAIVSSPLCRCAAFAAELAARLDRPLEIMPDTPDRLAISPRSRTASGLSEG